MSSLRNQQLQDILIAQLQSTPAFKNIPAEARNIINQSIEQVSVTLSSDFVNQIDLQSNQSLNSIPQNLIGANNPVNVVSGNLSATQLKNTLGNSIGGDLNNSLSSKLTNGVINSFQNKLPDTLKNSINLESLKNSLSLSSTEALTGGIDKTIESFSNKTLAGDIPINPLVPDASKIFENQGLGGLETVNKQFDSALASQAINESKNFVTLSNDNKEKLITQTVGFIDPSATYPTKEYQNRPETNKLAQGDVSGTIVQTKEKDRLKGIQLPNEQSWEQPQIPFKGEYPYNKVIQTEGGHIIEMDDTPGSERLHVYHKSGTFIEIDSSGSVVKRTKGSSYEIIDRNGYVSVTGDAHVSVKGSIKVYVGGDADIEVEGDTNIKCKNDITMQAAGRVDISATEEINLHSANVNIEADMNLSLKGDEKAFLTTKDLYLKSNASMYTEVTENYHLHVTKNVYNETLQNFYIKAATNTNIQSVGEINILSTENTNIDGDKVWIKSDKASEAESAEKSKTSISSNIGLIGNRVDVVYETISNPIVPNYLDKYGYTAEDSEIEQESVNQQNQLKLSGIVTDKQIDETQIPIETISPKSSSKSIIEPDVFLLKQNVLPDNFQLSKHFTLAQLSSKAVVSNYPVVAQLGLTYGELVYNLQAMALNVCEPTLALYPNMFVTSAFRTAKNSSTTSDHPRGKAVDIQFKNVSKSDYFNIAKKLAENLNYDKLLLEYKTYGTGLPWIHISFDVAKQRKLVLTYLNDKKYGDGLTSLA